MGKFVPVSDPEKARSEQDENALRKHRQFDTPHAHLKEDLNKKGRQPKEDMNPMGRQTGNLELDENQLWQKKIEQVNAVFDQEKTWGRETFQMGNQEQANCDGKKTRDVMAEALFGKALGFKGGRGADTGDKVLQRCEVNQALVKNDKGLWVRVKSESSKKEVDDTPVKDDEWRCPKCGDVNIRKRHLCKECHFDRSLMAEESGMLKAKKTKEDPRLEAAAAKGRGTADAAAQALKALQEKRNMQKNVMDDMGLTSRPERPKGGGKMGMTVSSSAQQAKPSNRMPKHRQWQTVQKSGEDARKVVAKALGDGALASSSAGNAHAGESGDLAAKRKRERSPSEVSLDLSERSGSNSPARQAPAGQEEEVTVDFF